MQAEAPLFDSLIHEVGGVLAEHVSGRITTVQGLNIIAEGLPLPIGAQCCIHTRSNGRFEGEVVGLRGSQTLLTIFGDSNGIAPGDPVECMASAPVAPVGMDLLGRVVNGRGQSLDNGISPVLSRRYPLYADPPPAMNRRPISEPLGLGVRAIDGMLSIGRGQRIGIFAGTGVGKSVLMGQVCRYTQADVNVIALIGERGREVRDFLENQLGPEGLKRSVVIVCTSDEAPALRVRACFYATAVAEFFRNQGNDVLLMMDSITRMAMAQRQIGLAAGEPPTAKGYPPSAFALLPRLLERAGRTNQGSITGVYTVLVEGGDVDEPLADAVRGILDGHIWLARSLANRGHFPAIDVLNSISRVADDVIDDAHRNSAKAIRAVLATWNDIEDLVSIGAYAAGANIDYDVAVRTRELVTKYLRQDRREGFPFADNAASAKSLGELIEATRKQLSGGRAG